jgi:hypothetical protein
MNASLYVEAVGIAASGLPNWQSALPILRGETAYQAQPLAAHVPMLLPQNERRRATGAVRLAFQAGEDALQGTSISAAQLATVFASSDADLNVMHRISSALAATPRLISPTDFHNSVHNAAAGYWSIAVGSTLPSTSISAFDGSFAAGLMEAAGCAREDGHDVMLIAFDLPAVEPLLAKRPIAPLSVALILTQTQTARSLACIDCVYSTESITCCDDPQLEALRVSSPAGRALPLLQLLAAKQAGRVVLPLGPLTGRQATLATQVRML